jgi:hypothetical protein
VTCRLCLRDLPLHDSHIIPEFMYGTVYDPKHRYFTIPVDGTRASTEQKGIRERMLCAECEQRIGQWERYVAHLWQGIETVRSRRDGKVVTLEGVDYARFKLFQMSVLWRAAVSTHTFFSKVRLHERDEDALRTLLLASDPGSPNVYGCVMSALVHNDKPVANLMLQPTHVHMDTCLCYRFIFGGMIWVHVAVARVPPSMKVGFLQPNGVARFVVGEMTEVVFLQQALRELIANFPELPTLR